MIVRESLRGDVLATWKAAVEIGFFSSSGDVTPQEVFDYWREGFEMYWAEQPFTVTPEYVAAFIERRFSPIGPSGNAFQHAVAPPEWTMTSRIEMGAMSAIAGLRARNDWRLIAAEYFENAPPLTAMGKLESEFFKGQSAASNNA